MKKAIVLMSLVLGFSASAAQADELVLVSGEKAGGVQTYSLDFVTQGDAVAFQFNIDLPEGVDAAQVDLSECVAELPKSHEGQCAVAKGQIVGMVYSDVNEAIPAGMISVGAISVKTGSDVKETLKVAQFLVSDKNAKAIESSASVVD